MFVPAVGIYLVELLDGCSRMARFERLCPESVQMRVDLIRIVLCRTHPELIGIIGISQFNAFNLTENVTVLS